MTTTPTGVRVVAVDKRGDTTDVTDGVMALYDLVINSMDWGSGFLTIEDAMPVVAIAKVCGFAEYERAEAYVASIQRTNEIREFLQQYPEARATTKNLYQAPHHDHVFPSMGGECMWVYCKVTQP